MPKVYKLIQCRDKLKQVKNDVFVSVEVRCIFQLSYKNKFTIPLLMTFTSTFKKNKVNPFPAFIAPFQPILHSNLFIAF